MDSANYDKEKVEKANSIYKTLMETNPDDEEALDVFQRRASWHLFNKYRPTYRAKGKS